MIRVATILWGIWFARNKWVWENRKVEPIIAMNLSSRLVKEWQLAQKSSAEAAGVGSQVKEKGK